MEIENSQIIELTKLILSWLDFGWKIAVPIFVMMVFKPEIKNFISFVKLKWSDKAYSTKEGQVKFTETETWWLVHKITFSEVVLYKRVKNNGIIRKEMSIGNYVDKDKIYPVKEV